MTPRVLAVLALACASCINVNYTRTRTNGPVADEVFAALQPGATSFEAALDRLGAPTIVWPSESGDVVLAYAWRDLTDWGISLSWSFERMVSAELEWDSTHEEVPAVVLQFDRELRLTSVKKGLLRALTPEVAAGDPGLRALADAPR